jgi:hypothetical protein
MGIVIAVFLNRKFYTMNTNKKVTNPSQVASNLDEDSISVLNTQVENANQLRVVQVSVGVSDEDITEELFQTSDEKVKKEGHLGEYLANMRLDKYDYLEYNANKDKEKKEKLILEKEQKKDKYYVEKVGPKPDFSSHGDFADILELEYQQKVEEYKKKVEEMKKKKAEDIRLEKIQKENEKAKIAKYKADLGFDRKRKQLEKKIRIQGHSADIVGFNESHKLIKLGIPRTYHRLINYDGKVLCTAQFIELSTTMPAFYFYDADRKKFRFYAKVDSEQKYTQYFETDTQKELWNLIIELRPSDKCGFMFQKYEQFSKGMYY